MLGEDPDSSFNLLVGQIILNLWQMVDMFNLLKVPKDPMRPVRNPYHKRPLSDRWCLMDYVPEQVRSSGTYLSAFPYYCAGNIFFSQFCLFYNTIHDFQMSLPSI